jgi:hypothetical protein
VTGVAVSARTARMSSKWLATGPATSGPRSRCGEGVRGCAPSCIRVSLLGHSSRSCACRLGRGALARYGRLASPSSGTLVAHSIWGHRPPSGPTPGWHSASNKLAIGGKSARAEMATVFVRGVCASNLGPASRRRAQGGDQGFCQPVGTSRVGLPRGSLGDATDTTRGDQR